ncbi:MAG: DUF1549 domain-containing protein [Gemmataceae bacterium]
MRLALFLLAGLVFLTPARGQDDKKSRLPKAPEAKGVPIIPPAWKSAAKKVASPAEMDALLAAAQRADQLQPAPLVGDDLFLRRVTLDLTGKLPTPRELSAFMSDSDPNKRAKLIEKLLASDEFARYQARWWRDIMLSKSTNNQGFVRFPREQSLEVWLTEAFKTNKSWAAIATELITSEGMLSTAAPREQGHAALLLAHAQQDGPVERTNDISRLFLGINISCAQCHDHPDDIWKRQQFHEMAAFLGRLGERVRLDRESTPPKFEVSLTTRPFGEYRMPDLENPRRGTPVSPRFLLDGSTASRFSNDKERRKALAAKITDKNNYYFAASFANRIWGQLLGQPFVDVEGMGPLNPPLYGETLMRLADSFRASDYDIRGLYRLILNTQAYQRATRAGEAPTDHVRFSGSYPTRLSADALYAAVQQVIGSPSGPGMGGRFGGGFGGGFGGRFGGGLAAQIRDLFAFDPSSKPEDIEGSVPQALLLMNNPQINAQIRATGNTPLAKILREHRDEAKAVEAVYLHTLGRKPTANETKVSLEHVASTRNRGAAYEDLMWALINSAEFRTRR